MRIFIVGMPGAGNLGDDLISAYLVRHAVAKWPKTEIGILTHGQLNSFAYPKENKIYHFLAPIQRSWNACFGRKRAIKEFLKKTDLVLIGGGGLFQDSHSPFTTHKWLQFAYLGAKHQTIAAVGVGFGPFRYQFSQWYLKTTLRRLSLIQVRDIGSQIWVDKLGYTSQLSPDIVLGSAIDCSDFGKYPVDSKAVLGCAIRPWPGQQTDHIISLIAAICRRERLKCALFVFEHAEPHNTSENDFAKLVARRLEWMGIETEIYCYNRDNLGLFLQAFVSVSCAIASRYHANILWQKIGKPIIPIAYAPKVDRLYAEKGGKALAMDNIDSAQASTMFQVIPVEESYNLPAEIKVNDTPSDLRKARSLVTAVNMLDAGYKLGNSLTWRTKRVLENL